MKLNDLALARIPGVPTIHPEGRYAVVDVRGIDLDADDYHSRLWLLDLAEGGRPPRELTGGWRDGSPRYSPDGAWLAFTRAERGADGTTGKPQLWVLPTAGGEPRRVTDHPLGASQPVWSPDSTRLAYLARVPDNGRYGTEPERGPEKEPPRRITRFGYRYDNEGFLLDRRMHVWVVDVATALAAGPAEAAPVRVTQGDFDHENVDWSPAGDLLTFVAARHEDAGLDLRSDVWVCRPDGTGLRVLTDGWLACFLPRFGPGGDTVYFAGCDITPDRRHEVARHISPFAVPVEGGPATRLMDVDPYTLAHPGGQLLPVADGLLFTAEYRGEVRLLLVPYEGGQPRVLIEGPRQVTGADMVGDTLVASVTDDRSWGEVLLVRDGRGHRLTGLNAGVPEGLPMRELTATAPDGYPVHGWLVLPAEPGPYPLVMLVHGGPFTQYGWRRFDEAQVLAGAGYAVLMGNPRGSSGYGQEHGRAILGNVGEVSSVDVLALLDAAVERPEIDGGRVAVWGGSHGGYMASWLAAHHGDRFRTSISERAVNAIDSFTGSSDIGWFFADDLYGPDPEGQRRQSPLTYADQITIPMLIIHSEHDWRCPVEQAQRLFVALRRRGAPVEMLLFPGEGHELSRSGLPSHRVTRFEAVLDWLGRHL